MGLLLIGSVVAVMLGIALVVDLRDRKRGGRPQARGSGLRTVRRDDVQVNPDMSERMSGLHLPPGL